MNPYKVKFNAFAAMYHKEKRIQGFLFLICSISKKKCGSKDSN
jgi:hypothetical protein